MRSLDRAFVLPTARRQVIRDTSIAYGSFEQGFSDLSFFCHATVMLYPFARSMGFDFKTPSNLCTVSTRSSSPSLRGGKGLCDTSIAFGSIKQGFSNLGFSGTPTVTPYPFATSISCDFSDTFETLHNLDRTFVPHTARRQGLCDTSIAIGSIKQGFSNLSFFWHAHSHALPLRNDNGL